MNSIKNFLLIAILIGSISVFASDRHFYGNDEQPVQRRQLKPRNLFGSNASIHESDLKEIKKEVMGEDTKRSYAYSLVIDKNGEFDVISSARNLYPENNNNRKRSRSSSFDELISSGNNNKSLSSDELDILDALAEDSYDDEFLLENFDGIFDFDDELLLEGQDLEK
ncbi:MAG: hypothetical protein JO129_04165 [Candidatus Dependentiae bacterium]|nr:hypothetical protein [Candidatus Dependentiae bacterium]